MLIDPMTPPKTPVTARAPSSSGYDGAKTAEHRPDDEARVEEEKEPLTVELVGEAGRDSPEIPALKAYADTTSPNCAGSMARSRMSTAPRGEKDHEVEDDGELEEGQDRDDGDLVARELHVRSGGHSHGRHSDAGRRLRSRLLL